MPAANLIKSEIKDKLDKQAKVVKLGDVEGEFDLLINGTPVGMFPKDWDNSRLVRNCNVEAVELFKLFIFDFQIFRCNFIQIITCVNILDFKKLLVNYR